MLNVHAQDQGQPLDDRNLALLVPLADHPQEVPGQRHLIQA